MANEFQVEAASLEQLNQLMKEITDELNKQAYLAGHINTTYGGQAVNNGSNQASQSASAPVGSFGQASRSQSINKIPTNLLKDYRGLKDVFGAQGGIRMNPYGAYRQVSQIREYAGYVASRIAAPNVVNQTIRILPGGGWASVPQFQTATVTAGSGGGWGAAGTPVSQSALGMAIPGGAAMATVAAIGLAAYAASIKLTEIEASNYAGQYNADTQFMKATNSAGDVVGIKTAATLVNKIKIDVQNRILQKEKATVLANTSSVWGGFGYILHNKLGFQPTAYHAGKWIEGNDAANTLVRGVANFGASALNFVFGMNNPKIKSKQEREQELAAESEKDLDTSVKLRAEAESAAMRGDIQMFQRQHDLKKMSEAARGFVENIYKDQNAGKIHRIAEEGKMASRRFNFSFTEWKKPRDD